MIFPGRSIAWPWVNLKLPVRNKDGRFPDGQSKLGLGFEARLLRLAGSATVLGGLVQRFH